MGLKYKYNNFSDRYSINNSRVLHYIFRDTQLPFGLIKVEDFYWTTGIIFYWTSLKQIKNGTNGIKIRRL